MKIVTVLIVALVASFGTSTFAFADTVEGRVVAFDRKAGVVVLDDKTIWTITNTSVQIPENLEAGNTVEIDSEGGSDLDGYGVITEIRLIQ